jgi:hypothetical protein
VSRRPQSHLGEQHAAYRKGLVLGLTMAEVGILIIFVLLLLIGYQQTRYDRLADELDGLKEQAAALDGRQSIDAARLAELTDAESRLTEVARALGVKVSRPPEDFRRLVRVVQEAAAGPEARQELGEARQALDEIKAAAQQMRSMAAAGTRDSLPRQVEAQSFRIANQDGQLARYEKQLQDAGEGKGQRPCWVEPDGTIDYLYDVVLDSYGIRMRERTYLGRATERGELPVAPVNPDEELSEGEFLRRTEALYRYSETLNCRFFVVVYDGTGAQEKPLYKSELRAVEGHFYKLLSPAPAPF